MDLTTLLMLVLAVVRLSSLIALEDGPFDLARRARAAILVRFPPVARAPGVAEDHWVARGVSCPLCVSFWLALPAGLLVPWPLLGWLGIAGGAYVILRGLARAE